ncbi:hypothetical protein ACFV0D_12605 [Streptomyces sp. NPDC059556]|uniref:hypothetical protein n=1 Tax=Streptomyces sp. NPDC059556 TaxID=3346863 RepID=UPI00368367D7
MSTYHPPFKHLDRAAEHIRTFNHLSQSPDGRSWQYPGDAYDALGNLSYLAGMLAQAIEQATRPVQWTVERGQFRMDGGMDVEQALAGLQHARNVAAATAARLAEAIGHLHNTTSPMGATITEDADHG